MSWFDICPALTLINLDIGAGKRFLNRDKRLKFSDYSHVTFGRLSIAQFSKGPATS